MRPPGASFRDCIAAGARNPLLVAHRRTQSSLLLLRTGLRSGGRLQWLPRDVASREEETRGGKREG
jgi:hypothetical protein